MVSLKFKIERVSYANLETGYVVLRGFVERHEVTAVGILPDVATNADVTGVEYELEGDWQVNKYGRQFSFVKGRMVTNHLFYFLTKVVKGLGAKLAGELIERLGEEKLMVILEKEPERLLQFKGIKEKKLSKIVASWQRQKNLRELSAYLLPHGITPHFLVRAFNYFGDKAVGKIKENPYCLTEIRGIGFKTADKVALKLGLPYDSPFRIQSALLHCLLEAAEEEGHTYLPHGLLMERLKENLDLKSGELSPATVGEALRILAEKGEVYHDEFSGCVSLAAYKKMEDYLLSYFQEKSKPKWSPITTHEKAREFIERMEQKIGFSFSPEQKNSIFQIATGKSRVYTLLGYAGTGKTTMSRTILEFLAHYFCRREEIVCCAFTGMASARIRKLSGFPAYTIHTLLKYKGENEFEYGPENRLPYRVILLDEASMVNLQLFYRLVRAIDDDALFIMVGDPAQLPPIGAGNVFGDLVGKDFLIKTTLNTIFRQEENSVLVHFANLIRKGEIPPDYHKEYDDFSFLLQDLPGYFKLKRVLPEKELKKRRDENNEKIKRRLLALAASWVGKLRYPAWDFQVLSPMRLGILGTEVLNPALQEIFNPKGKNGISLFGITLKEGDKVVHLRNQDMEAVPYSPYVLKRENIDYLKHRVFNGTVGLVRKIDHENDEILVLYPDNYLVRYSFDHIRDLIDLAYCLTVHKAQGSQCKYIAIPLSNSHFMMLNNKWFYTALTRAEKKVFIVGQEYAFRRACTNIDTTRRFTFLSLPCGPA